MANVAGRGCDLLIGRVWFGGRSLWSAEAHLRPENRGTACRCAVSHLQQRCGVEQLANTPPTYARSVKCAARRQSASKTLAAVSPSPRETCAQQARVRSSRARARHRASSAAYSHDSCRRDVRSSRARARHRASSAAYSHDSCRRDSRARDRTARTGPARAREGTTKRGISLGRRSGTALHSTNDYEHEHGEQRVLTPFDVCGG